MINMRLTGDWHKCAINLKTMQKKAMPFLKGKINELGELVLETLQGHIDSQDLNWIPLASNTITMKDSDTIFVETGFLRSNLTIRKLRASSNGYNIIIGANPWQISPSGEKLSDILMWLEYGTSTIPPRPLVAPTFKELRPQLEAELKECVGDLVKDAVS